jgi:hypothetical protein
LRINDYEKDREKRGAETQGFTAGKRSSRRLVAGRRIYSIAWRAMHDGYTMILALPIDVCVDSNGQPDVTVQHKGDAVKISRSRKSFSIFRRLCRFLTSSLHPKVERLLRPYLLRSLCTEHRQI